MGIFRKVIGALFAGGAADDIADDSSQWMVQCPCGCERSYAELGGVRFGAVSKGKRVLVLCKQCGKLKMHRVYRKSAAPS